MDLSSVLLRWAAARPPVLVVTAPGGTAERLGVERELRSRGWPAARNPAEASLLVVCGEPGPGLLPAVDRIWSQLPAPRARVDMVAAGGPATALDLGRRLLADPTAQQRDAASRGHPPQADGGDRSGGDLAERKGHDAHAPDDGEADAPAPDRGEVDPHGHTGTHGAMGHGQMDHGRMDHGNTGMAMELPGGWAMADRAPDRDGLALDALHVPLGPVLPCWPHGLVVRCRLQGDVIQDAEAEIVDAGDPGAPFWDEPWLRVAAGERVAREEAARRRAACHLDSLARLLGVVGWSGAALRAARLRDDVLTGQPAGQLRRQQERFARRVGRSRLLRWSTDGINAGAGADVTARWLRRLTEATAALEWLDDTTPLSRREAEHGPRGRLDPAHLPSAEVVEELPVLLTGAELAAARLIVAALDPDPDELAAGAPAHEH